MNAPDLLERLTNAATHALSPLRRAGGIDPRHASTKHHIAGLAIACSCHLAKRPRIDPLGSTRALANSIVRYPINMTLTRPERLNRKSPAVCPRQATRKGAQYYPRPHDRGLRFDVHESGKESRQTRFSLVSRSLGQAVCERYFDHVNRLGFPAKTCRTCVTTSRTTSSYVHVA